MAKIMTHKAEEIRPGGAKSTSINMIHNKFLSSVAMAAATLMCASVPSVRGFGHSSQFSPRASLLSSVQTASNSATLHAQRLDDENEFPLNVSNPFTKEINRRDAIRSAAMATLSSSLLISNPTPSLADIEGVVTIPQSTSPPEAIPPSNGDGSGGVTIYKTKSGLQYIDLLKSEGPTPRYGNFVTISYKAYVKLPDNIQGSGQASKLDEFDSDSGYLIKHGNGRTIPGLDEALHTMTVNSKRRVIIPPKLGYVASGLGPIPSSPYGRWKLNRLLDRMVEVKGGNVIMDVEMLGIMEDEADQGYYEDDSLSPEDFNTLRMNIEAKQQAARAAAAKS